MKLGKCFILPTKALGSQAQGSGKLRKWAWSCQSALYCPQKRWEAKRKVLEASENGHGAAKVLHTAHKHIDKCLVGEFLA